MKNPRVQFGANYSTVVVKAPLSESFSHFKKIYTITPTVLLQKKSCSYELKRVWFMKYQTATFSRHLTKLTGMPTQVFTQKLK